MSARGLAQPSYGPGLYPSSPWLVSPVKAAFPVVLVLRSPGPIWEPGSH